MNEFRVCTTLPTKFGSWNFKLEQNAVICKLSDLKWNAERQKMWHLWRCYWDECLENFLWFVINHQDWLHANTKLSKEPAEEPRRSVWKVTETYLRAVIHTWRKHVLNLPRTDQPTAKTCRPFESRHICIRRTAFHKESVQQQPRRWCCDGLGCSAALMN